MRQKLPTSTPEILHALGEAQDAGIIITIEIINQLMRIFNSGGCEKASPFFNRRRFDSSLVIDVKKCRFNHIQVLICKPLSKKLRPFPTTFWLMCPHLIKLAGKIESQGGVNELENFLRVNNLYHEWHEYNFLHQVIRLKLLNKNLSKFMRNYHEKIFKSLIRGGVGGIRYNYKNINVKCLHLQTASFIGLGRHPGEKWLKEKNLCGDCEKNFCSIKNYSCYS